MILTTRESQVSVTRSWSLTVHDELGCVVWRCAAMVSSVAVSTASAGVNSRTGSASAFVDYTFGTSLGGVVNLTES